jgi:peroxiredoxin
MGCCHRRVCLPLLFLAPWLFGAVAGAAPQPSSDKLGKKIDFVTFATADGKAFALRDLKDRKAVVAVFLSFECPVSTSYSQELASTYAAYRARGVSFVGIVPGSDGDAAQVARQAREYKLPFPVFPDAKLAAADAFKAEVTPQAFVLDHNLVLRYRGRIDNGYAARLKKNQQVTSHDLRQALDQVLAGRPVRQPVTPAVGCPIQRGNRARVKTGKVTFYRDVLPILQNHCQVCHRPGEVGPFALMTYKQAVNWASDIKEYTGSRKMPPWKPSEGVAFHNQRRLADRDIATLAAWADADTPEGDPKDAPPPRKFPAGWQLGKPDLVLEASDDFQLGPSGNDRFRCFVLPTHLTRDRDVVAVEIRPSNPRVVHHVLLYVDGSGQARKLEQREQARPKKDEELDRGPGYSTAMGIGFFPQGGLGGWAPGQMARYLPADTGYPLPKGSDVVMQVHYHRNGRLEKDRTRIGLYLAGKPVKKRYKGMLLPGFSNTGYGIRFTIPKGADNYKIQGNVWADEDCTLYTVMPHMHLLGKKIRVTVTPPDGKPQTLVAIDDWDYNWQETYLLKEPLQVKAGTRFAVEAWYDNSARNPNNPFNPPRDVKYGEQTTNEMCFVFLGATNDGPGRRIKVRYFPRTPPKKAGP